MSSDYLKAVAAGGEFDQAEAIRELARVLTDGPIEVKGVVKAEGFDGTLLGPINQAVSEPSLVAAVTEEVDVIPPLVDAPEPPKKMK